MTIIHSYFPYHVHSDYSLLDSCTKFEEYADLVKVNGGTAIASTEHGLARGWVSKKLYCDKIGIKFVHGVEMYLTEDLSARVRDNYHTVLLAKNQAGIYELNRLMYLSTLEDHFYYTNRISFDEFLSISDNIIKTSACLASPLNKLDESSPWFEKLLRHYDYLEVQPHNHPEQIEFNKKLVKFSRKYGIPLVAGTDTHSSTPYKAECRSILMAAKNKSYGDEDAFDMTFKTAEELVDMFRIQGALSEDEFLEAIGNTNRIADACENFTLDQTIKYPILHGSPEEDERVFVERTWSSLDEKIALGIIPAEQEQAFRESVTEELRVFKKLKMCGFMLSMSDLIRWCKEQGMAIGTSRGSCGGSRVAYLTDIIDLNPEQWNTVFSRFANEDRVEIGDIDIDCVYDDRPMIFQYITTRFGADRTARVAAYGTLADKSVIDEVGRALFKRFGSDKYSLDAVSKLKKRFAEDPDAARKEHPDVFYYYDGLAGTRISQSVHPAGMVISPISLIDEYGVFAKDGENCLLMDMEEAHEVGAAKYDFLALKTVKVIRDACNYIGIPYPKSHEMNWLDQDVWDDIHRSQTAIFQFESAFAADSLKKFNAKCIEDMTLVTACIRPSGASYREQLLARQTHKNPSKLIDDLLANNLGFLIYQEDTIQFLQKICGLSGSEADNIRRAIGRKQKDRLDKALPSILDGYCKKSDKPRAEAEAEAKEFLQIIEDSASYQFGFNHALGYSLLSYYCGFFRYHYPIEFATAFLNNAQNDDDVSNGAKLAAMYGIRIASPKFGISKAEYFFNKDQGVIAKGLASVKYMSAAVADELYDLSQQREYLNFVDLLIDIENLTSLDSRQLDILIKIDYFSRFGNQRELFAILDAFNLFKQGSAKTIRKDRIAGTPYESIVEKYSSSKTKSGADAKSYTIIDMMSILSECEDRVLSLKVSDLPITVKARNFNEIMGYAGYTSGEEKDRNKLYIVGVFPVRRKKDNQVFGYSIVTRSLGSGKESRFTVFKTRYEKNPIKQGDIIVCKRWERDGMYFRMLDYEHLIT